MILETAIAGTFAGAILLFFSHVAPIIGAGNFIRDLDQPRLFRANLSKREAHLVGALVHLLVSAGSGAVFGTLVFVGVVSDVGLLSILGWGLIVALIIGGIVLPLEGHGLFGTKEDAWFPVDLLLTQVIWGILFWWVMGVLPSITY